MINIPVPGSIIVDPTLIGLIPPAPPAGDYPVIPSTPSTSDHAFPDAPVYTLPIVPTLHDIVIPEFIDMTIEQPTMKLPVMDFDVPAINQILDGGLTPEDALVQSAKAKLLSNIVNGGTMLNPQVEADLWNRDLERQEQQLQDSVDKLTAQWAKLGWGMPDGLLAGSLIAVNNEYMNKKLDRSREISVKQAELEQAGMFKSLELIVSLEKVLIDNMNDYARRVFETSKATADVTIAIFKERINRYNSLLAAFKADMEFLVYDLFGTVAYEVERSKLIDEGHVLDVEILVLPTEFGGRSYRASMAKGKWAAGRAQAQLIESMTTDTSRNDLILKHARIELESGQQVMLLTQRVEHARTLDQRLSGLGYRSGVMIGKKSGGGAEFERTRQGLLDGSYRASAGTIQIIGQGLDLPSLGVGFITTPLAGDNARQKFGQARGRFCRPGKERARLYYVWDRDVFGKKHLANLIKWNTSVRVYDRGQWVDAKAYLKAMPSRAA